MKRTPPGSPRSHPHPSPRLRRDRVVLRVESALLSALSPFIPPLSTLLVTATAPLRRPAALTAAIIARARPHLARRPPGRRRLARDAKFTLDGVSIGLRLIPRPAPSAPSLMLLVHNPNIDPAHVLAAFATTSPLPD